MEAGGGESRIIVQILVPDLHVQKRMVMSPKCTVLDAKKVILDHLKQVMNGLQHDRTISTCIKPGMGMSLLIAFKCMQQESYDVRVLRMLSGFKHLCVYKF